MKKQLSRAGLGLSSIAVSNVHVRSMGPNAIRQVSLVPSGRFHIYSCPFCGKEVNWSGELTILGYADKPQPIRISPNETLLKTTYVCPNCGPYRPNVSVGHDYGGRVGPAQEEMFLWLERVKGQDALGSASGKCKACGAPISSREVFCPRCGRSQT